MVSTQFTFDALLPVAGRELLHVLCKPHDFPRASAMHYLFGDYELDEQLYQLRRTGELIEIEPKVFDLLVYLIEQHDRVVTKDELLIKLWPGQVVSEMARTQCVMAARKAVGDDGARQHTIKTQHGRGYRFVAPLSTSPPEVRSQNSEVRSQKEQETAVEIETAGEPEPRRLRRAYQIAVGVVLFIALFIGVRQWLSEPSPPQPLIPDPQSLPLPDKPSIIILPFVNLSGDPRQEYFSDGMTEELTAALSRLSSLFVIARTSAFTYKGKATKVQEISREMGVRYVLEGSARKADGQVRIIAQLIDATTGEHLWTERYDRPLTDIFTVQDEIVQRITTTLKLQLTLMEKGILVRKTTANLDAYDFYLRGSETLVRAIFESDNEVNAEARKMYEKAIELDPQYALAHQGLSRTYWLEWFIQVNRNASQSLEHAFSLAQQAVALDNTLPSAHSILGAVAIWKKQHEQALMEGERAVTLDPNFADGFVNFAQSLVFVGRPQEALSLVEQAMRLNPHYPAHYLFTLGVVYRELGRYQEAITVVKKFLALNPRYPPIRYHLAICYAELGQNEEARAEIAELLKLQPYVSLEAFRKFLPYKNPVDVERHLAALRKAGLK